MRLGKYQDSYFRSNVIRKITLTNFASALQWELDNGKYSQFTTSSMLQTSNEHSVGRCPEKVLINIGKSTSQLTFTLWKALIRGLKALQSLQDLSMISIKSNEVKDVKPIIDYSFDSNHRQSSSNSEISQPSSSLFSSSISKDYLSSFSRSIITIFDPSSFE